MVRGATLAGIHLCVLSLSLSSPRFCHLEWREREPFASHLNVDPCDAILVDLLLDVSRECNGAHDPVAKLLIEYRLVGIAIVLHNLVETVDQRLFGRHLDTLATVWEARQLRRQSCMINLEAH